MLGRAEKATALLRLAAQDASTDPYTAPRLLPTTT
jgi:hypothetical protein